MLGQQTAERSLPQLLAIDLCDTALHTATVLVLGQQTAERCRPQLLAVNLYDTALLMSRRGPLPTEVRWLYLVLGNQVLQSGGIVRVQVLSIAGGRRQVSAHTVHENRGTLAGMGWNVAPAATSLLCTGPKVVSAGPKVVLAGPTLLSARPKVVSAGPKVVLAGHKTQKWCQQYPKWYWQDPKWYQQDLK